MRSFRKHPRFSGTLTISGVKSDCFDRRWSLINSDTILMNKTSWRTMSISRAKRQITWKHELILFFKETTRYKRGNK